MCLSSFSDIKLFFQREPQYHTLKKLQSKLQQMVVLINIEVPPCVTDFEFQDAKGSAEAYRRAQSEKSERVAETLIGGSVGRKKDW